MPIIKVTLQTSFSTRITVEMDNKYSLEDKAVNKDFRKKVYSLMRLENKEDDMEGFYLTYKDKLLDKSKSLAEQGITDDVILNISRFCLKEILKESNKYEKNPALESSGIRYLFAIRSDNLYKIVVDGHLHRKEKGFKGYEAREEGSVGKVLEALLLGIPYIYHSSQLSEELIQNIHRVLTNIPALSHIPGGEYYQKNYNQSAGFNLEDLSVEGVYDLRQFAKTLDKYTENESQIFLDDFENNGVKSFSIEFMKEQYYTRGSISPDYIFRHTKTSCKIFIDYIVRNFNDLRKESNNDISLVKAIIDVGYNIEHLHGFKDANLRTSVVVIDILLMAHGFPPVSLYNPNYIDGLSKNEIFQIVKEGMLITLDMIKNPDKDQFDFNNSTLTSDLIKLNAKIAEPVIEAKTAFKLKSLEESEINEMEKRIIALPSYPQPKLLFRKGFGVEDIEEMLDKDYPDLDEKSDKIDKDKSHYLKQEYETSSDTNSASSSSSGSSSLSIISKSAEPSAVSSRSSLSQSGIVPFFPVVTTQHSKERLNETNINNGI